MSLQDYPKLKHLQEEGILSFLYKRGFLSEKIFARIECIETFKKYRIVKAMKKSDAIKAAADELNINHMTVRRAIEETY